MTTEKCAIITKTGTDNVITLGYKNVLFRWQPGKVILNNKGARFVVLEPSSLSLAEIEANDYNFDHLTQHFGTGVPMDCEFPLNLSMQRLACGGMLMVISFTHLLCDANSFYLFVADFASQMKNSTFKFSQQEVIFITIFRMKPYYHRFRVTIIQLYEPRKERTKL